MKTLHHLPAALLLLVAGCLAVFGTPFTALVLGALGALAWRWPRAWLAAPLLLFGWKVPLLEYADRVEVLAEEDDWSTRDRAGVWLLNLGMAGAGAVLGMPEVALETALLAVPGDGARSLPSDFALGSPGVRRAIRRQVAALPPLPSHDERGQPVRLEPQRVVFPRDLSRDSARVGLALSPVTIGGVARPTPEGWVLKLQATVPIDYPERALLRFFSVDGRSVHVDEALFHRLEEEGWLHRYDMTWTWSMPADDARLEGDWIGRAWAEHLVVRGAGLLAAR